MQDDAGKNFANAQRITEKIMEAILEFFENVHQWADTNKKHATVKLLAQWVQNNQASLVPLKGADIYGLTDATCEILDKDGVPYIRVGKTILVNTDQQQAVQEANKNALIALGNYYQEVELSSLETVIATKTRLTNKDILKIDNLSDVEARVLKNKCNDISRGFMVGVQHNSDGSNIIGVHAKKAFHPFVEPKDGDKSVQPNDFCKALLATSISLYGPNNKKKIAQIQNDLALQEKINDMHNTKEVQYLISVDDPNRYIEFSSRGFELYQANPDAVVMGMTYDDPDCEVELARILDTFENKAILTSSDELKEHTSTKDRNFDSPRPEKDEREKKISLAEKEFTDQINEMIKEKLHTRGFDTPENVSDAKKCVEIYKKEVVKIATYLETGQVIKGYKKEDLKRLKDTLDKAGVSIKDYKKALNNYKTQTINVNKAIPQHQKKSKPEHDRGR